MKDEKENIVDISRITNYLCASIRKTSPEDPDENEAFAYADIYSRQHLDIKGILICRIWLLSAVPIRFIVNWHDRDYEFNEAVRSQIYRTKKQMVRLAEKHLAEKQIHSPD